MVICPLKDKNYIGNCEQCTNREYCMLNEIMEKLHKLEDEIAEIKSVPTR